LSPKTIIIIIIIIVITFIIIIVVVVRPRAALFERQWREQWKIPQDALQTIIVITKIIICFLVKTYE